MPAIISLDPRVSRTIRFTERARLQLIAEAFNVLNHQNITGVRTTFFALANTVAAGCPVVGGVVRNCLILQTVGNVGIKPLACPHRLTSMDRETWDAFSSWLLRSVFRQADSN
jgi:hypothetical protein